jgi:hypothetical protein
MKNTLSVLAIATLAAVATVPAHAGPIYMVNFTGIVDQTQGATGESIGSTVTGHFDLDGGTGNFLDFTIAGKSVAPGYTSMASIGPALFDAIYTAQVSPVLSTNTPNSTFSLDLSSLTNWPSTDTALTLLTDKTQLTTNLDTITNPLSAFPSTFDYFTANADGTNIVSLSANLTSIAATVTPEPASLALVAGALVLGLGLSLRRRAGNWRHS